MWDRYNHIGSIAQHFNEVDSGTDLVKVIVPVGARVCENLQHESGVAGVYHESAAVSVCGDRWG